MVSEPEEDGGFHMSNFYYARDLTKNGKREGATLVIDGSRVDGNDPIRRRQDLTLLDWTLYDLSTPGKANIVATGALG
jgi:hypothetical protein